MNKDGKFEEWCKEAPEEIIRVIKRREREDERKAFSNDYLTDSELELLAIACQEINQKTAVELIGCSTIDELLELAICSGATGIEWLGRAPRKIRIWSARYFKYKLSLIPDPTEGQTILVCSV